MVPWSYSIRGEKGPCTDVPEGVVYRFLLGKDGGRPVLPVGREVLGTWYGRAGGVASVLNHVSCVRGV